MSCTEEKIKNIKYTVDKDACKSQKIRIKNIRSVMIGNVLVKVTGRIKSDDPIIDKIKCVITIENSNREIIDSKITEVYFCERSGIFDATFYVSDIKKYCGGSLDLVSEIGILPLIQY
ncbi:MAG: hypothetical protein Q4C46_02955 [Bacillota bacterium]|nr:hypothetical protein [Bacillota bacterium]